MSGYEAAVSPICGTSDERNLEYARSFTPEKFFRELIPNRAPVIFDVGAHKGESVKFFSKIFSHSTIYSFEPDPENYQALLSNCTSFEPGLDRWTPVNVAVGNQLGTCTYFKQNLSHLGGLLPVNRASKDSLGYAEGALNEEVEVEVTTLDHYVSMNNIDTVDLIKIDVQGFELDVLKGGREVLRSTRVCIVEISLYDFYGRGSSLLGVEKEMKEAGLVLWDILKISKNPKNFRTDWVELCYARLDLPR